MIQARRALLGGGVMVRGELNERMKLSFCQFSKEITNDRADRTEVEHHTGPGG